MSLTKVYTKSPCALDSLIQSIQQDANITISLDLATTNLLGNQLTIGFKTDMSDWTEVDTLVANHDGVPLPQNTAAPVTIPGVVTTQFERTDIVLKMARIKLNISSNVGSYALKIPGTFGVDDGRYIAGGYAMMDTFDPDDNMSVTVNDNDRLICAALGLATDGTDDSTIQGMGVLPGPLAGFGALPNYPLIESYADTSLDSDNQGWYFYPLVMGNSIAPMGEIDFEPLGFYGHIPSGLYIVINVARPNVATGILRGDIFWGISAINA